jgi:inorganic pyrophosphatase
MKNPSIYRMHPWHGLPLGEQAPAIVNCYVEMVPTDTVKYELDKSTGILKVDRPQKYSSLCPALYGFLPKTYCGELIAAYSAEKIGAGSLVGDGDPLDICILTERVIVRGDIMIQAIPIGGFRMIDGDEADDKIISVMVGDFVYEKIQDISDCPEALVERLRHYFLTYKDSPERTHSRVKITHIFGRQEAHEIINAACRDYLNLVENIEYGIQNSE